MMIGRSYAPLCAVVLMACGGGVDGGGAGGAGAGGVGAGGVGTAGVGAGGVGGVAGSEPTGGVAAGGSTAGEGGAPAGGAGSPEQLGYDQVIGCDAVRHYADVLYWATPQAQFRPTAISGDGLVVVGSYNGFPVYWSADDWFNSLGQQALVPDRLNCDGSSTVLRDTYTDAVWHLLIPTGGAGEIIPASGGTTFPLALSPDGATVIANLDSTANPGPRPTRWTASGGVEELEPLQNTLVYRTGNDNAWLVGADIRHIFRYEPGVGKSEPWPWPDAVFGIPPELLVSADGSAYAFRTDRNSTFGWVRNGQMTYGQCPNGYCTPVDVSGTGRVVLLYGVESGIPQTFIYTDQGYRSLSELLASYGAPIGTRALVASAMSNDAQAFTGVSFDPETWEEKPFYATLPPEAYDWAKP